MRRKEIPSAGLVSGAILAAWNLYWAVSTFLGVEETFSAFDLWIFSGTALAATLVEILAIVLADRFSPSPLRVWAAAAAFMTFNAWTLHLVFIEAFMELDAPGKGLALAVCFFVAFTTVRMACESGRLRVLSFAAVAVLLAAVVWPHVSGSRADATETGMPSVKEKHMTSSKKVREVKFVSRPNVYFIGFESAAPAPVLEKYLGLKDAPLPEAFEQNGFRVLKNAFSERFTTLAAFDALLAMERTYYRYNYIHGRGKYHLFPGLRPSPLIEIFRANGYETSTLYKDFYFGRHKGRHVDNYYVNKEFSVCEYIDPAIRKNAFFRACDIRESPLFPEKVRSLVTVPGPQIEFLMHCLEKAAARGRPQFVVAHIGPPTHTPSGGVFRGTREEIDTFRSEYRKGSREAAGNLRRIREFIESKDPGAIVLAFGDHGTWISRNLRFRDDPAFHVRDKYAVLAGIYPRDACREFLDISSRKGHLTVPEASRRIVQCLAGGVDPFVDPGPYAHLGVETYDGGVLEIDFGDYRYE